LISIQVRTFTGLPDVMIIVVTSGSERMRNMMMQFPFLATNERKFNQYPFTVPGFTFQMFTGYDIPDDLPALCSARSKQIYQAPDADSVNMKNSLAMVERAPPEGKARGFHLIAVSAGDFVTS